MWSRGSKPSAAKSRGRADVLEHDEVVLAAGRGLVGAEVGDRHHASLPGRLGLGLRRPRRPSPRPAAPWCGRAAPASPRPGPAGPACRAASARPASRSNAAIAVRRRLVGRQRPVDTSADSPRLAWAARTRSGSSRSSAGVDHAARLRRRVGAGTSCTAVTPRGGPAAGSTRLRVILSHVSTAARDLAAALGRSSAVLLFAVLAFLVIQDRAPLDAVRRRGRRRRGLGRRPRGWVEHALRVIEVAFGTTAMTIFTVVLALGLCRTPSAPGGAAGRWW